MLVQKENRIGDVVADNFRAAKVFEDFGLDFCCGGKKTIQQACSEKGINPDTVLTNLTGVNLPAVHSAHFNNWDLDFLIDYIITNHHSYVINETVTIEHHLQKVLSKHGENHPELHSVNNLFLSLKEELYIHMQKEEKMLFPYIKKMVLVQKNGLEFPHPPFGAVASPVSVMEAEHDSAGNLAKEIRKSANDYNPPSDACTTFRILYSELAGFESDLHVHIHLENNILFPKAVELEKVLTNNN